MRCGDCLAAPPGGQAGRGRRWTRPAIPLFETMDDLRTGDAALNEMNPSSDDVGRRVSVESYEVAIDIRAG